MFGICRSKVQLQWEGDLPTEKKMFGGNLGKSLCLNPKRKQQTKKLKKSAQNNYYQYLGLIWLTPYNSY